ncbi:transporter [Corallococcus sp. CA053C]|uniref:transporter n=1 Tax=Corallococcus sp. CA053C TaxID=2316732 RepID=UPI001F163669|nr:transporter [Corallococcus sp. CA053C]
MRTLPLAVLCAALLVPASRAWACASCACGDPTLTSMGGEQPFEGRLRLSTMLRAWGHTEGQQNLDAQQLRELRMDVAVAYAPRPWLVLAVNLPLQAREVRDVSLARERGWGLGDIDVSAKAFVWKDREFSPDQLISVVGGLKLPTGPRLHARDGTALGLDAQPGSGSVDPMAGLAWQGFRGSWSFGATVLGYLPTRGREDFRLGASVRTSVAAQYQPSTRWAVRLGVDSRVEKAADTNGEPEANGGGFIAYASPDVLFSPGMDVVLQAGVRLPFINQLRRVSSTPIAQVSLAYDL